MCEQRAISTNGRLESCIHFNLGRVSTAERELAAFAGAVNELFGAAAATQSVEDWMEELQGMDWPDGEATPDWRQVTVAAAARLARRVSIPASRRRAS